MTRKNLIARVLILFFLWVMLSLFFGRISAVVLSKEEYRNFSHLLSTLSVSEPEAVDTLMQSLKAPSIDSSLGDMLLDKYNYTPDTFLGPNLLMLTGISMVCLLVPFLLVLLLFYRQYRKNRTRIEELTTYLEEVNTGEEALIKHREDQYSILEDQIYKTVTQLRETRESALKERKSLADNLADISHQLKTPITSMSLMAQLLSDHGSEENAAYIDRLLKQLTRMDTLVASLLTLSKLDAGALPLEWLPVDVNSMLLRATEPLEDMIHQKKQTLLYESDQCATFTGDITWSAEALLNIIKNCSEHTPEGGSIRIGFSENPLYTELIIQDNGKGFDSEELDKIFKRYYKGKTTSKDSIGIGLALSKAIIEKQKGIIRAENASEGGARFIIHFYK